MTTIEVERKYAASHAVVRDVLEASGFRAMGTVGQTDTYYDHPSRSFAATDEALRVRRTEDGSTTTVELTYKGPRKDWAAKTRRETTVVVDDAAAVDRVLRSLDLVPVEPVIKTREGYHRDGVSVVLDHVAGLGEYVEVEVVATAGDVDAAVRTVESVVDELGLDPDDRVERTYLGMCLDNSSQ